MVDTVGCPRQGQGITVEIKVMGTTIIIGTTLGAHCCTTVTPVLQAVYLQGKT
jgi:hypothetical protein